MKEDWQELFNKIDTIPLVLPELKIGGIDVTGWRFIIETWGWDGKEPYLKAMYQDPKNHNRYIFNSSFAEELLDYLKEFNLLKEQTTK